MRRVRDLMQTDVVTIAPDASVADLVRTLEESGISGAPVVDAERNLVGVVSGRDVLRLARELQEVPEAMRWGMGVAGPFRERTYLDAPVEGELFAYYVTPSGQFVDVRDRIRDLSGDALSGYAVRDIMTGPPVTVSADATVPQLARLLRDRKIHRVLVVEADKLMGIVSTTDLLEELAEEAEETSLKQ